MEDMNILRETLISFETAKLAKEKGCDFFYDHFQKTTSFGEIGYVHYPQSLLQKWLRETTDIEVTVSSHGEKEQSYTEVKRVYTATVNNWAEVETHVLKGGDGELIRIAHPNHWHFEEDTYEEALEKGLQEALKLINGNNNK